MYVLPRHCEPFIVHIYFPAFWARS